MPPLVRPVVPSDLDRLLMLNNAAVPAVNRIDAAELARLVGLAEAVFVADDEGEPVGFVLTLRPGCDYASENYAFFSARGSDFLYVDRIVVSEIHRGAGIGRLLYRAVFERAAELAVAEVCCEVNLDPPNPGSSRFHASLGFRSLGSQPTKGGSVTVDLLAAPVMS